MLFLFWISSRFSSILFKGKFGITITFNFGASGSLQQQIEHGAPVDIFISAAAKQMDALEVKGLTLDDTRKNLLENKIVLIAQKDSSIVMDFKDLTSEKVKKLHLESPKVFPLGNMQRRFLLNWNC